MQNHSPENAQKILEYCVVNFDHFPSLSQIIETESKAQLGESSLLNLVEDLDCVWCNMGKISVSKGSSSGSVSCDHCANGLEQRRYADEIWRKETAGFKSGKRFLPVRHTCPSIKFALDTGWDYDQFTKANLEKAGIFTS